MVYKDILAPVLTLKRDQASLKNAAALAQKFEAKASALIVSVNLGSDYAAEQAPLSAVLEDITLGSSSHAGQERKRIEAWLARAPQAFELRNLTIEAAAGEDQVVAHARVSDLIVTARPLRHEPARHALVEDVLFKSGRPVFLVPENWGREGWQTIVIGWNAKAEAVRAVTGALPLLQSARRVIVATVDAAPSASGHSEIPGHEIAAHLARHGVTVEVHNVDGLGRSHARALMDEAIAADADLLVLGAYGHSRAREFVLGGVTRELLTGSSIPLLMAH